MDLEEKFNPWNVENLEEFHFYCCPECEFRIGIKGEFINHAVVKHPRSHDVIDKLEGKKNLDEHKVKKESIDDIEIIL